MCETMGIRVTVYAYFVDGVIDSLLVSCQRSVMPTLKPAGYTAGYRASLKHNVHSELVLTPSYMLFI